MWTRRDKRLPATRPSLEIQHPLRHEGFPMTSLAGSELVSGQVSRSPWESSVADPPLEPKIDRRGEAKADASQLRLVSGSRVVC